MVGEEGSSTSDTVILQPTNVVALIKGNKTALLLLSLFSAL